MHGDVKGNNILINDQGEACLIDFGLARTLQATGFTTPMGPGSLRYLAPERVACSEDEVIPCVTKETDVWAFAMAVLEILTGSKPFHHIEEDFRVAMFVAKGGRPKRQCYLQVNDNIWCMLQRCWGDPGQRPSMIDLNQFFAEQATFGNVPCSESYRCYHRAKSLVL